MDRVTVAPHPLAGHLLAGLRDASTPPERYRVLARRLSTVLALEATRGMPVAEAVVETPLMPAPVRRLARPVVAVPILRAGLGLLEAVTDLLPEVGVGYVGLERDEATLQPTSYYFKVPPLSGATVLLLDPMLATGGTAAFATQLLREQGAAEVTLVCVIAAPEGIERLMAADPEVRVVTAAVDEGLNEVGYIVPGLGDFGDRLFGTG
jgi:uracil phosphoribosyltransferase